MLGRLRGRLGRQQNGGGGVPGEGMLRLAWERWGRGRQGCRKGCREGCREGYRDGCRQGADRDVGRDAGKDAGRDAGRDKGRDAVRDAGLHKEGCREG